MTLEKRIELIELTLHTLQSMREKYKRPKQIDNEIAFNSEILGYLKELQEFKSNSAERPTGAWKLTFEDRVHYFCEYECTVCKRTIRSYEAKSRLLEEYPYCHCGAKMREGEKEC